MSQKKIIIGAIIVVAIAFGVGVYSYKDQLFSKVSTQTTYADETSAMYKQYMALEGEEYDRSFIANMIEHHQGAVDMAKLAQKNAKHQELKDMADEIVIAQEKEIGDMTSWQKKWDYPVSNGDDMRDHSSMGMMDDMAGMTGDLEGKTGDEFDKAFIEQMIVHHQSAIDMAASGETNAKHAEVKELTKAIIAAQAKEISQMQQWQKDWGYSQ